MEKFTFNDWNITIINTEKNIWRMFQQSTFPEDFIPFIIQKNAMSQAPSNASTKSQCGIPMSSIPELKCNTRWLQEMVHVKNDNPIAGSMFLIMEFSLNNFFWIQRIQWIMTKFKSSMVIRDILYLTIDTFLDIVVKSNFPLLSVDCYLFPVVSGNRYLPRGSNKNTLCITSTANVSVASWVIPLVTMLLLDLVTIHWIRWIHWKSFRENSNVALVISKQLKQTLMSNKLNLWKLTCNIPHWGILWICLFCHEIECSCTTPQILPQNNTFHYFHDAFDWINHTQRLVGTRNTLRKWKK